MLKRFYLALALLIGAAGLAACEYTYPGETSGGFAPADSAQ